MTLSLSIVMLGVIYAECYLCTYQLRKWNLVGFDNSVIMDSVIMDSVIMDLVILDLVIMNLVIMNLVIVDSVINNFVIMGFYSSYL